MRVFGGAAALVSVLVALACTGGEPTRVGPAAARPEPPVALPETPPAPGVDMSGGAPIPVKPADVVEALPPIELDCALDADCALSNIDIVGDGCCPGCLTTVVNTRWKGRAEAFCAAHPADSCPKKRCGEVAAPRCRNGECSNDP